jgi:hypothetical protein
MVARKLRSLRSLICMKNVLDPKAKLTWVTASRIKILRSVKLAAVSNITPIPEQSINLALAA